MATKIYLNAYRDASSTPFVTYEARNLQNLDFAVAIPVTTFGLPEFYLEGAILTKAEGNTGKIVFSWVIKDEITNPFSIMDTWSNILSSVAADEFYPNSVGWAGTNLQPCHNGGSCGKDGNHSGSALAYPNGSKYTSRRLFTTATNSTTYASYDTLTSDGQMIALSEYFEKKGFSSAERHRLIIEDDDRGYLFNAEGNITRLSFQKSGTDPVTWNASIEFQMGDVVDSTEA